MIINYFVHLKAIKVAIRDQWPLSELGYYYWLTGNKTGLQEVFDELFTRSKTEFISDLQLFSIFYYLENYDEAFEFLESAFRERDGTLVTIKVWPIYAYLRKDPRFQEMIKRMNFPD